MKEPYSNPLLTKWKETAQKQNVEHPPGCENRHHGCALARLAEVREKLSALDIESRVMATKLDSIQTVIERPGIPVGPRAQDDIQTIALIQKIIEVRK